MKIVDWIREGEIPSNELLLWDHSSLDFKLTLESYPGRFKWFIRWGDRCDDVDLEEEVGDVVAWFFRQVIENTTIPYDFIREGEIVSSAFLGEINSGVAREFAICESCDGSGVLTPLIDWAEEIEVEDQGTLLVCRECYERRESSGT